MKQITGWGGCVGLCLVLGVLAARCASVPTTHYYTLDMAPTEGIALTKTNLLVERLRPSEALARPGLLVKKTPTQVEYYAADHWAANLGELVTQKLSAEFGAVVSGRPTLLVSGSILEFSQIDTPSGAEAHVQLDINIRPEGTSLYRDPLMRKVYDAKIPAQAPTADSVVLAMTEALEQIAARVAADVEALDLATHNSDSGA